MAGRRARVIEDEDFSMEDMAAMNLGVTITGKKYTISEVYQSDTFKELLPFSEARVEEIKESMLSRGFDSTQPIHLWMEGKNENGEGPIVIDGNTRLEAARRTHQIFEVVAFEHHFKSEKEAIKYALELQIDRRNLDSKDLLLLVEKYVELGGNGNRKMKEIKKELVEKTNMSLSTINRAIAISKDEESRGKVLSGEASITQEYRNMMERKNPKKEKVSEIEEKEDVSDFEIEEADSDDDLGSFGIDSKNSSEEEKTVISSPAPLKATREPPKVKDDAPIDANTWVESDIKQREFARGFKVGLFYAIARAKLGDRPEDIYRCFAGNDDLSPSALNGFDLGGEEKEAINTIRSSI